jgi:hypothetical protein
MEVLMDRRIYVPFFLIAMLLLAACSPIISVKANSENTQQAVTATASATPTATPPAALPTPAPTAPAAPTQIPTLAPTPLPTQIASQTPVPTTPVIPCNLVGFVADVTFPDGTLVNPGDSFTKTWKLQNNGTCSWTTDYALVFTSGDLMSGPTVIPLPNNVNPGSTIDLSVSLIAPINAGTYQGNWMLRSSNGTLFGLGVNADQSFWVRITVNNNLLFAVTSVDGSVNPSSYIGTCPTTFSFDANIWANAAGTVTYYWIRSDGSKSPVGTLTYTAAGYQTVVETLSIGTPGSTINGWDQVYIDQPNHQAFGEIYYNLICDPVTPTPTQPVPTPTTTQPAPTPTPTLPAPTPIPTQPAPTPVQSQPVFTPTPNQPDPNPTIRS